MKRASDYQMEKCYTGKTWAKQHKNPDCRYLKGKEVIETNRREAYRKGANQICVYCWWDEVPKPEAPKPMDSSQFLDELLAAAKATGYAVKIYCGGELYGIQSVIVDQSEDPNVEPVIVIRAQE